MSLATRALIGRGCLNEDGLAFTGRLGGSLGFTCRATRGEKASLLVIPGLPLLICGALEGGMRCCWLIKNAIVCWNYLYLSQRILDETDEERRQDLIAALTVA